jgi:hypothetical protein
LPLKRVRIQFANLKIAESLLNSEPCHIHILMGTQIALKTAMLFAPDQSIRSAVPAAHNAFCWVLQPLIAHQTDYETGHDRSAPNLGGTEETYLPILLVPKILKGEDHEIQPPRNTATHYPKHRTGDGRQKAVVSGSNGFSGASAMSMSLSTRICANGTRSVSAPWDTRATIRGMPHGFQGSFDLNMVAGLRLHWPCYVVIQSSVFRRNIEHWTPKHS